MNLGRRELLQVATATAALAAANPYLSFFVKVAESGTLKFTWTDDNKQSWTAESKIEVA